MSFNPHVQGGIIWDYMHLYAANAVTEEKRREYVYWLNSQKIVFFCENCRLHLIENLEQLPVEPYMKSNVSLFYHSWKLHDIVNGQLNKPLANRLTYPQAFEKYFGRPPPTLEEESKRQAQPTAQEKQVEVSAQVGVSGQRSQSPMVRMETGMQQKFSDDNRRFMTRAGHPPNNESGVAVNNQPAACSNCGRHHVENGPKVGYDEFRGARRKIFTTKN